MKDIKEYVGAHVLSLVRAHYPLLEIARLKAGYPREVGAEQANELRSEEMKHAAAITKDIILCLATTHRPEGQFNYTWVKYSYRHLWLPAKHIKLHPQPCQR
jgi:hypothetical protein